MQVTPATLQNLNTGLSTIFLQGYRDTPTPIDQLATRLPSNHKIETYGWMQRLLAMREWIGPRIIQNLATSSYQLTNRTFESTLAVDREEIEDDALGLFNPRAYEFGRIGARIWFQLLIDALTQGNSTGLGFDGLSFFNTSHTVNPAGVQSNSISGAGSAFSAANLDAGIALMRRFSGEDGRFLGVNPTHLIIPPELDFTARTVLRAAFNPAGATNVYAGALETIVVPELAASGAAGATSAWYLADLSAPIKPLILQVRRELELTSKTALDSDNVFWQKQFVWGIDCRGVAGYGPWWLACRFAGS